MIFSKRRYTAYNDLSTDELQQLYQTRKFVINPPLKQGLAKSQSTSNALLAQDEILTTDDPTYIPILHVEGKEPLKHLKAEYREGCIDYQPRTIYHSRLT